MRRQNKGVCLIDAPIAGVIGAMRNRNVVKVVAVDIDCGVKPVRFSIPDIIAIEIGL